MIAVRPGSYRHLVAGTAASGDPGLPCGGRGGAGGGACGVRQPPADQVTRVAGLKPLVTETIPDRIDGMVATLGRLEEEPPMNLSRIITSSRAMNSDRLYLYLNEEKLDKE